MGYSRGNDRGGGRDRGRGGFGGNRGGGRDRERPEMHKAVCSDCGVNCEVPFKPTNDKPIYCSDCFRGHENDSGGGRDRGRGGFAGDRGGRDRGGDRGGRSGFGRSDREMHKAVCDECGKNCEVPFRPTNDKPIYCSECFGNKDQGGRDRGGRGGSKGPDNSKQLKEIIEKLDKLISVIAPTTKHKISLTDKKTTSKTKSISNPKRENRKTVSKPKKVSKKKVVKEKAKKVVKKAAKKKPTAKKKAAPKKK
ncbi:MAG: CxxC-x17-CxxC domain-containing protein [Candidatus Komeilibacteria bacterium]